MSLHVLNVGVELGQRKYGNSRPVKRSTAFQGIPVSVEIEIGEHVKGLGWEKTYSAAYGEIPGSCTLADGEGVDVYLGPTPQSEEVFVVHQQKRDGSYDEDKVFLGFTSMREAVACYFLHGPEWGFMGADQMTVEEFKNGYLAANRKFENDRKFDGKKLAEWRPCPGCDEEVKLVDTTTGLCKPCFDKEQK